MITGAVVGVVVAFIFVIVNNYKKKQAGKKSEDILDKNNDS